MADHDTDFDSVMTGQWDNASIDKQIGDVVLDPNRHLEAKVHPLIAKFMPQSVRSPWFVMVGIGFVFVNILLLCITILVLTGIGVWGNNQPAGWGFDIINFVWWIGIGHAGTLISAILLLLRQPWRNAINRFAEAMTIFAVMCAGMYPLLHTGRPWVAYWLMPYPNVMSLWPQFRSPLIWDVFAVTTYLTVSVLFWYVGLIPDLATLRDRATKPFARTVFGMLALGWNGGARAWLRYNHASIMLAGLSAPLVLSVHSIVSFDFAMSIVPGWTTTIFPPYFVAGAVFAGFAMVIALAIPIRKWYRLEDFITMKHFDWMAKVMLATGLIVAYGYAMEMFYAWYSGQKYELSLLNNRGNLAGSPYAWAFYCLMLFNVAIPTVLWFPKIRKNLTALFIVSMSISIGMWFERYVIIPLSLTRDYLPSSYGYYTPTIVDFGMFFGTIGFFIFMMFLFIRFLPMINIFEMKELWHHMVHHGHGEQEAAVAGEAH